MPTRLLSRHGRLDPLDIIRHDVLADPSCTDLVRGLSDADSWATDGHRWLNVAYGCGIVFMRDGADLRRSFGSVAGDLPPEAGYEACDR